MVCKPYAYTCQVSAYIRFLISGHAETQRRGEEGEPPRRKDAKKKIHNEAVSQ